MTYYSNFIWNSHSGIVKIRVPNYNNHENLPSNYPQTDTVCGILVDDPQIQMQNNFGPIAEMNDALKEAQETQQTLGGNNLLNYIPASAMAWQSTQPIKVVVNFYMISMNKNSNIKGQLKKLATLATLKVVDGTSARFHGGYRYQNYDTSGEGSKFLQDNTTIKKNDEPGTCIVIIDRHTIIKGLLLQTLQYQPSTVSCRNGEPLYYNVHATFTGHRPPITEDMDSVFGG